MQSRGKNIRKEMCSSTVLLQLLWPLFIAQRTGSCVGCEPQQTSISKRHTFKWVAMCKRNANFYNWQLMCVKWVKPVHAYGKSTSLAWLRTHQTTSSSVLTATVRDNLKFLYYCALQRVLRSSEKDTWHDLQWL